jgi:mannose/cellobiose epimerase-like protein (N-acyl-D-glucosamine 2-epimerase family)
MDVSVTRADDPVPALRPWLLETVLPLWAEVGVDRHDGGFVERLTPDGRPSPDDDKRVLVQARQIYVFSHAHLLGAPAWALEAARHGVAFLTGHYWDDDGGGWRHKVTRDGASLDRRKDAYDHAFVLFAMAWYHRASGDPTALAVVRRTLEVFDGALAEPEHGGCREHVAPGGPAGGIPLPRRQNPHMHLLEALLALYEATGDPDWRVRAERVLALFRARFFDAATGTLGEYFGRDWQPAPAPDGPVREPGHHFEWVWLLLQYWRLTGDDTVLDPAERLYRFAMTHGFDRGRGAGGAAAGAPPAAVLDRVDPAGAVLADTKRLWPQTEAVKAWAARHELLDDAEAPAHATAHLALLFRHYLDAGHGLWREWLDRDGREISHYVPATSLYHVVLCMAEAMRVLGR